MWWEIDYMSGHYLITRLHCFECITFCFDAISLYVNGLFGPRVVGRSVLLAPYCVMELFLSSSCEIPWAALGWAVLYFLCSSTWCTSGWIFNAFILHVIHCSTSFLQWHDCEFSPLSLSLSTCLITLCTALFSNSLWHVCILTKCLSSLYILAIISCMLAMQTHALNRMMWHACIMLCLWSILPLI